VVGADAAQAEVGVCRGLEHARDRALDERRVPEDLAGGQQMEQYPAAARRRDGETRDAGEHDVQRATFLVGPVDDLAAAIVPRRQSSLDGLSLLGAETLG